MTHAPRKQPAGDADVSTNVPLCGGRLKMGDWVTDRNAPRTLVDCPNCRKRLERPAVQAQEAPRA